MIVRFQKISDKTRCRERLQVTCHQEECPQETVHQAKECLLVKDHLLAECHQETVHQAKECLLVKDHLLAECHQETVHQVCLQEVCHQEECPQETVHRARACHQVVCLQEECRLDLVPHPLVTPEIFSAILLVNHKISDHCCI